MHLWAWAMNTLSHWTRSKGSDVGQKWWRGVAFPPAAMDSFLMWKGASLINTQHYKQEWTKCQNVGEKKKRSTDTILWRCGARPHATGMQRFQMLSTLEYDLQRANKSAVSFSKKKKLGCSPTCKQKRNEIICASLRAVQTAALLWLHKDSFWPNKTLILSHYVTETKCEQKNKNNTGAGFVDHEVLMQLATLPGYQLAFTPEQHDHG